MFKYMTSTQRAATSTAAAWFAIVAAVTLFIVALLVFVARTQMGYDDKGDCIRSGKLWYPQNYDGVDVTGCVTVDQVVQLRAVKPKNK